jgi:hypothetical protein
MRTIRLGQMFLNIDMITHVSDLSQRDVSGVIERDLLRVEFSGGSTLEIVHDAPKLRNWLLNNELSTTSS